MLTLLPFVNVVILMMSCYVAGFAVVGLISSKNNRLLNPERRLRIEVRSVLSQLLLETVEQGETPTILGLIDRCPPTFQQGRAWEIWTQESYKMTMEMLCSDRHQL
jgi:hypothetical protein